MSHNLQLRRRLRVERLEHRDLLAGNVLVTLNGGGNLTIRGDAADNQFSIEETAPDEWTFTDTDPVGDTTFNGAPGPFVIAGITGNVRADLKAGNDAIEFKAAVTIAGNLQIDTAAGNDSVVLGEEFAFVIGDGIDVDGSLQVKTGAGNDTVVVQGGFDITGGLNPTNVGGNVDIQAGQGDDSVFFFVVEVTGNATVDTSDGLDGVFVNGPVTFGGNLTIRLGHQNDEFEIGGANAVVVGAITVNASLGDDAVSLVNIAAGSVTLDTSDGTDSVEIGGDTSITGNLIVRLGLDNDTLEIGNGMSAVSVGGRLDVNASRGDDTASFTNVTVTGGTTIDTSDGVDDVTLTASTFAALTVKLGHQDDTLTVTDSSATSASLNGSAGAADTYDGSGGGNTGALDSALVAAFLKGFEVVIL
jgi:hypothetical protein